MLACQLAARELAGNYSYLEIGSHLGGSIQPHLLDQRCTEIVSIDKRPRKVPDSRGITVLYNENSTEAMLKLLRDLDPQGVEKVRCFDGDTSSLDPDEIETPITLCMIDGEHTDAAVVRDFEFCERVMGGNGAVICHDAPVVYKGLYEIVKRLEEEGRPFHAYNLPDWLLVFELGVFPMHSTDAVSRFLLDNHVGYLHSLLVNDHYRQWANLLPVRMARVARQRLKRGRRGVPG
jgi:hypothetical protein